MFQGSKNAVSARKFTSFVPGIGVIIRHLTAENGHSLLWATFVVSRWLEYRINVRGLEL